MTPITFRAPRNPNLQVWVSAAADEPMVFKDRVYETSDPDEIRVLRRHPLVVEGALEPSDTTEDKDDGDDAREPADDAGDDSPTDAG